MFSEPPNKQKSDRITLKTSLTEDSEKNLTSVLSKDFVTLSFQETAASHQWAKAPVSKKSNGATAGEVDPSAAPCQLTSQDTTTLSTRRRFVVQHIPLPTISKVNQHEQNFVDNPDKKEFKVCSVLEGGCCVSGQSKCDDKNCDTSTITTHEKEEIKVPSYLNNIEQPVLVIKEKWDSTKTPLTDRMLLRPSVINLPSLVTGASGNRH